MVPVRVNERSFISVTDNANFNNECARKRKNRDESCARVLEDNSVPNGPISCLEDELRKNNL